MDFQDDGHLGFLIITILAIFDLQVTPMLPGKFGVNWPFGSGEEAKNRFSSWRPPWISDGHDFSFFYLQVTLMLPSKFGVNWPFGSGEKKRKIDNQNGGHGSHLGFPIGKILAIFDLQVILMLPTKYRVNWPRGVGGVGF